MLENALRIAVDPVFVPPVESLLGNKRYLLFDNAFESNKFEIVFDEITDGDRLKRLLEEEK